MTEAQLEALIELKEVRRERVAIYAKEQGLQYLKSEAVGYQMRHRSALCDSKRN